MRCDRYGYEYPCENPVQGDGVCVLKPTDFRGAPCSDAAGAQKEYQELMQRALPHPRSSPCPAYNTYPAYRRTQVRMQCDLPSTPGLGVVLH